MFFLFSSEPAAAGGEGHSAGASSAGHAAESGGHHTPAVVEFVNHYVGEPVHHFQVEYTKPLWDKFFANFGTTAENVFGAYTVENAVPWYTVMFVLACVITAAVIWILMPSRPSEDDPTSGQLTLEAGVLGIRQLLEDNVGPHGLQYFPVVATFGILILISNLMGLVTEVAAVGDISPGTSPIRFEIRIRMPKVATTGKYWRPCGPTLSSSSWRMPSTPASSVSCPLGGSSSDGRLGIRIQMTATVMMHASTNITVYHGTAFSTV